MTTSKKVEKAKEETKTLLPMELLTEKSVIVLAGNEEPKEVNKDEEIERLKKLLEETRKKLQEPENLEERIQYYQRKQELISRLDRLTSEEGRLKEVQEEVIETMEGNDFECNNFMLSVGRVGAYKNETVFSMNNPALIGEVIGYVLERVASKMEKLREEISY